MRIILLLLFALASVVSIAQPGSFKTIDTSKLLKPDTNWTARFTADTVVGVWFKKDQRTQIIVKKVKFVGEESGWTRFRKRVSIRQTFQNVKDKDEAAFVNLVNPKDSANSYNFSFALGFNIWNYVKETSLTPFFEWQKNTLADKKQDAQFAGLNWQLPLLSSAVKIHTLVPYLITTVNYKRDGVKHTKGLQGSLFLTPIFANKHHKRFYPLPDVEMKSKGLKFVYNVYAGLEYEDRMKAKDPLQEGTVWRWAARASGKIYPLASLVRERVEIVPEITYRNSFEGNATIEARENIIRKISFNLIILDKTKDGNAAIDVKIGFDHTNGVDPTKGFDGQRINTVTIKVKF
jgi:hypothetical protein